MSSKCQKVSDPIVRKTILKKEGNCFVCLKHGHISRNCPSKYKCFKCSEKHHISICSKDQNYNHVWKSEEKNKQEVATDTKHNLLNNHLSNQKSNGLLQTAQANVQSLNGKRGINGRLLFDSGSQRSYIREEIKNKLRQDVVVRIETVVIKTFGEENNVAKIIDVVALKIIGSGHKAITMEAFVVPNYVPIYRFTLRN